MSDQIDKMLKEMEEFNKKYGLSTAGLSSSCLLYTSPSQLRRKGRFSKTQKKSPALRPQPSEPVLPAP